MAREDVVDELSSSEQVQQDAGEKLRILAEEKRVEEEEARREAEIQEQLQAELAQQQAEAEAARLRAEKLENARLAKEKVEEAKRLEAEKQAAEAARVAAEAEADRAEAERMSLEAEAETTSEPVEQVVETKRACTNSSTDWALGEWGSCDLGTLLKTRSIIHVSDCDRDAAGAYIPDDETPCNPCDDIDLKAVCEGTTYKSRPTCNSTTGVITYGTITENSDKCDYVAVLDCVESDWTTGTWSVCNNSGISTREVTKKTNVTCNGFAAKPSDQYSCVNNEIGTGLSYAEINCVDQGTRYQNSEGVWSDYYGEIYNNNSKSCSIDANTSGTQTCNDGDYGGCNALGTCEAELHWNDAENKCDSNSITQTCTNSTKPSTNSIWTAPSGVNNADGSYESIWTGSTYSPSNSDCQWSCENNYALEDGVCINQKTVNCDSSNTPNNAQASIASVEINYTDADGWSAPAECSFVCDSAYSRDENSCKQNPPAILNLTNVEWSSNDLSLTFADVAGADSYKLCD